MKTKLALGVLAIVIIATAGYWYWQKTPSYQTYKDPALGFAFSTPQGWDIAVQDYPTASPLVAYDWHITSPDYVSDDPNWDPGGMVGGVFPKTGTFIKLEADPVDAKDISDAKTFVDFVKSYACEKDVCRDVVVAGMPALLVTAKQAITYASVYFFHDQRSYQADFYFAPAGDVQGELEEFIRSFKFTSSDSRMVTGTISER